MVLIVNLNTTIDTTYLINDFKKDKIFRPEKTIKTGGGKGVNVARVLNYLKIKNKVIGFAGGFNKNFILSSLKNEKINFIPVQIKGDSRVCTIILDLKNSTETVINENGPVITQNEVNKFLSAFKKELKNAEILAISGSMPKGVPFNLYADLINIAKKNKIPVILDTSKEPLFESIKAKPNILKVNKNEIKYIYKKNYSLKNILKDLNNKGIAIPIITIGEKGSLYLNEEKKVIRYPAETINKISTIGSGDAFTAGIIYGILNKKNITESIKAATHLAALNAMKIGAGCLPKIKK